MIRTEATDFQLVSVADLIAAVVEVPGEGDRLLMCLTTSEHDHAADGVTIVAMAHDWETLAQSVREEGLYARKVTQFWGDDQSRTTDQYELVGCDGQPPRYDSHSTTGMLVLSVVPTAVRRLCLESPLALAESIRDMQQAAERITSRSNGL